MLFLMLNLFDTSPAQGCGVTSTRWAMSGFLLDWATENVSYHTKNLENKPLGRPQPTVAKAAKGHLHMLFITQEYSCFTSKSS